MTDEDDETCICDEVAELDPEPTEGVDAVPPEPDDEEGRA